VNHPLNAEANAVLLWDFALYHLSIPDRLGLHQMWCGLGYFGPGRSSYINERSPSI